MFYFAWTKNESFLFVFIEVDKRRLHDPPLRLNCEKYFASPCIQVCVRTNARAFLKARRRQSLEPTFKFYSCLYPSEKRKQQKKSQWRKQKNKTVSSYMSRKIKATNLTVAFRANLWLNTCCVIFPFILLIGIHSIYLFPMFGTQ